MSINSSEVFNIFTAPPLSGGFVTFNCSKRGSTSILKDSNSNISIGLYDLSVYDINTGCSVTETFDISSENLELSTSIDYTLGSCATVTIDVIGGTPPYTYETANSFQEDNNVLENMCSGEQLIMVTDANGCTSSTTIDIMETPDWDVDVSTDANHTILIPDDANLTFETSPLSVGSYIGVFYTNQYQELVCAGSVIWEGETTSVAAWGSEAGLDNGFEEGEEFIWGMWDSNTGEVQYGNAEYVFNPTAFTGQGNYMPNGLSGVASITTVSYTHLTLPTICSV